MVTGEGIGKASLQAGSGQVLVSTLGKHWQWASSSVSMPTGTAAAVSQSGSSATWHLWSCVVCICIQVPNENKNTEISPPSHRDGAHFILGRLYMPPVLELIICFKCIKTTMAIFKYPVIHICIIFPKNLNKLFFAGSARFFTTNSCFNEPRQGDFYICGASKHFWT